MSRDKHALIFSLIISLLLLVLEIIFSRTTNSLLLFSMGIIQLSLIVFILIPIFLKNTYPLKIRLFTAFVNGCVLVLLSGYIFIEFLARFSVPVPILGSEALLLAFICMSLNLLIFRFLLNTQFRHIKFGTFGIPVWGIVFSSSLVLAGTLIVYYTEYYFLDTLLSLVLGFFILIRAGFMTIDAYWHIEELAY